MFVLFRLDSAADMANVRYQLSSWFFCHLLEFSLSL